MVNLARDALLPFTCGEMQMLIKLGALALAAVILIVPCGLAPSLAR